MRSYATSSLDAMKRDIDNQPRELSKYCRELHRKRKEGYPLLKPDRTIFTGSGDSYSAALFVSELSNGLSLAFDPYELSKKPWLAKDKYIIIISVSGRTRTNIKLAKKLRLRARKVLAVTSDPQSPLALNCNETIVLGYQRQGLLTAGTSSYTSTLLACGFLLGKLPRKVELGRSLADAWTWAEKAATKPIPMSFAFIGSGLEHAVGYYGALKLNEVLGIPATCLYPEEFGHAYLFSVKKTDTLVCLNPSNDYRTRKIFEAMRRSDFNTLQVQSGTKEPILRSITIALHLQCLAYSLARKKGLRECVFLSDLERLSTSSRLIY